MMIYMMMMMMIYAIYMIKIKYIGKCVSQLYPPLQRPIQHMSLVNVDDSCHTSTKSSKYKTFRQAQSKWHSKCWQSIYQYHISNIRFTRCDIVRLTFNMLNDITSSSYLHISDPANLLLGRIHIDIMTCLHFSTF